MIDKNAMELLREIMPKIQTGSVALFLGAGASIPAGAPSGLQLSEMIKERFQNIDMTLEDFIEICQDVIDTPPYNRNELEEFIVSKIGSLQPTNYHKTITKYDWAAIFTTNFDDLIELTYRVHPERLKPCQAIYAENFQINPSDRSRVFLFKIMGSITAMSGDTGYMVLSRADYNRALIRRRKFLELLSDFIKTGTIVFIGYSFSDRVVFDIIDDLISIYGKDRVPWSFALFPTLPPSDQKTQYMLNSRRIIPIQCSFEDFCQFLEKSIKSKDKPKTSRSVNFKLRGISLEITETDARNYAEFFEIIDENKISQDPGDKDQFFMGTNKKWGAFNQNWDFKRDIYDSPTYMHICEGDISLPCLKTRVIDELRSSAVEDNKVILLRGMAGVGKTMMLRRLAYDIYKSGKAPVIFVKPTRINFDYRLLATFVEDLNHQLNMKLKQGQQVRSLKAVVMFDDAGTLVRHVNRLKDYLTSRGRPALIIAAERTGEWELMWRSFPFKLLPENIYELNEQLTEQEQLRIIDHFYNLEYIQTKGTFWTDIIEKTFENSFFATIYTLVHPSRKRLNDIIRDQYISLSEPTRKAFQFICLFHQFDLPFNMELLVRALKCSYDEFLSEVMAKDATKVVFEEEDEIGNILYRSHHRIIAKKTVELFFNDPELMKEIYSEIFSQAILSNKLEREICEKILLQHIGPNARPQIFLYEQQQHLFETICANNKVRTLIHHWGVLEADNKNYPRAEELLKRALEISKDDIESYRGESDQNILTSLGSLYSHKGIDLLRQGKDMEAIDCFQKAEHSFQDAKYGEFPNSYAYHSHAYMWYLRGKELSDSTDQLNCLAQAIEILSIARDNLNEEELQMIYELQATIWAQIGDEKRIEDNILILKNQFQTARGYYLIAQHLWAKAHDKEGERRQELLKLALEKVSEGLMFFPDDEYCLRLKCRLMKKFEIDDFKDFYGTLQRWKGVATVPSAWLLYELGRTAFILGYYDQSKEYFNELETGVGMGHRLRSRPRHPVIDENGQKNEFEGVVLKIYSLNDGIIRCDTLRNLKYPIAFRPIASTYTPSSGDSVRFNIEFSYRGPRATRVRKN